MHAQCTYCINGIPSFWFPNGTDYECGIMCKGSIVLQSNKPRRNGYKGRCSDGGGVVWWHHSKFNLNNLRHMYCCFHFTSCAVKSTFTTQGFKCMYLAPLCCSWFSVKLTQQYSPTISCIYVSMPETTANKLFVWSCQSIHMYRAGRQATFFMANCNYSLD